MLSNNASLKELCSTIEKTLNELGVAKGDLLYVASDIRQFGMNVIRNYGIEAMDEALKSLTEALQQIVGSEGTILLPAFSWDFCRSKGFDITKTQGEVGSYSNWLLNNRKDFKRTQHALYSFMVWGKLQDFFCNMSNQDAWGVDSPFYYLYEHGGKQLEFNVESFKGLTFIHCFEQWVNVPYRHHKYFFGKYTGINGKTEIRSYSMYVRDLDVYEHTKTTHQYLIDNGAAKETTWQDNKLTVVNIAKAFDVVKDDIINNDGKNNLFFKDYEFHYQGTPQTLPYEISAIPKE